MGNFVGALLAALLIFMIVTAPDTAAKVWHAGQAGVVTVADGLAGFIAKL